MRFSLVRMSFLILVFVHYSCQNRSIEIERQFGQPSSCIKTLLDSSSNYFPIANNALVTKFYQSNHFLAAWSLRDTLLPAADSLLFFIGRIAYFGLSPKDYHDDEIRSLLSSKSKIDWCKIDVLLTDSFFSIWHDIKNGRSNPRKLLSASIIDDSIKIGTLRKATVLNSVIREILLREPEHREYHILKDNLTRLLQKQARSHQSIKGQEITEPLPDSIGILQINMDRWRWESDKLPDQYILVNIPSFKLKIIEKGISVFESKIIVGKPETPTPLITSVIECFTIYPYWHIPRKIAINEILPTIQKDTSYITNNNLDVLDRKGNLLDPKKLTWKKFTTDNFPVILRQREGPENSLGVIKFQFDNPYAVYLHDTNAKKLFNQDDRALSHGCVRVEKAFDLALYLVRDDSLYCTPDDLKQYMEFKQRMQIDLVKPIPILIRYFTAEAKQDSLFIYNDLYSLDAQLEN